MSKIAAILAALAITTSLPALAHADDQRCPASPSKPAISAEALQQQIENLGYNIRRFKLDGGCYEMTLAERTYGGKVKVAYDAGTGELRGAWLKQ